MTTLYQAISSQEYPEHMYFDGRCYRLLDEDQMTNAGIILDNSRMQEFESCEECNDANPQNTIYVTYEQD
mgnify:FL=1